MHFNSITNLPLPLRHASIAPRGFSSAREHPYRRFRRPTGTRPNTPHPGVLPAVDLLVEFLGLPLFLLLRSFKVEHKAGQFGKLQIAKQVAILA
jgi:hypothetical protein